MHGIMKIEINFGENSTTRYDVRIIPIGIVQILTLSEQSKISRWVCYSKKVFDFSTNKTQCFQHSYYAHTARKRTPLDNFLFIAIGDQKYTRKSYLATISVALIVVSPVSDFNSNPFSSLIAKIYRSSLQHTTTPINLYLTANLPDEISLSIDRFRLEIDCYTTLGA